MRSDEEHVLIVRIKRQRPDSLARQPSALGIDSRPRQSGISGAINTAADFSDLISVAREDLVAVTRIDQDAREIAERQIAAPDFPRRSAIVRHDERLLGADINIVRTV